MRSLLLFGAATLAMTVAGAAYAQGEAASWSYDAGSTGAGAGTFSGGGTADASSGANGVSTATNDTVVESTFAATNRSFGSPFTAGSEGAAVGFNDIESSSLATTIGEGTSGASFVGAVANEGFADGSGGVGFSYTDPGGVGSITYNADVTSGVLSGGGMTAEGGAGVISGVDGVNTAGNSFLADQVFGAYNLSAVNGHEDDPSAQSFGGYAWDGDVDSESFASSLLGGSASSGGGLTSGVFTGGFNGTASATGTATGDLADEAAADAADFFDDLPDVPSGPISNTFLPTPEDLAFFGIFGP